MYMRNTANWGPSEQLTGESRWAVFIALFLQFFFKLENFQNEQLERRENMLDWMRKAMAGRAGVGLKTSTSAGHPGGLLEGSATWQGGWRLMAENRTSGAAVI